MNSQMSSTSSPGRRASVWLEILFLVWGSMGLSMWLIFLMLWIELTWLYLRMLGNRVYNIIFDSKECRYSVLHGRRCLSRTLTPYLPGSNKRGVDGRTTVS